MRAMQLSRFDLLQINYADDQDKESKSKVPSAGGRVPVPKPGACSDEGGRDGGARCGEN